MMWKIIRMSGVVLTVVVLVAGCGGKDSTSYRGEKYQPTTKVIPTFQPEQVPVSCRIFSHLLIWLPTNSNGKTIATAVENEARTHGADMLLIGGSRQAEDDKGLDFIYYGLEQEYNCRDKWCGWKFGYESWSEQGDWMTLGYKEWGNGEISYDVPILLQAAFLRCQE